METSRKNNNVKSGELSRRQPRANWQDEALTYWDSDLTLFDIAAVVHKRQPSVKNLFVSTYGVDAVNERKRRLYKLSKLGEKNPMTGKRFDEHHNWKERSDDLKGYLTVVRPVWYCKETKRVFEHHVVWSAVNGVCRVPEGFVIHHKDCNPKNNTPSNLQLMTVSEHREHHHRHPC